MNEPKELFDSQFALSQLSQNTGLLVMLLKKLLAQYAPLADDMQALTDGGNNSNAVRTLHTLKGVAANLGCLALSDACRQLENAIKQQQNIDIYRDQLIRCWCDTQSSVQVFISDAQ